MTDPTITMFSGLATRKAFDDEIIAAFTAESGVAVDTVYDPTVQLLLRIEAGEAFDVLIGATPSFDDLVARGIVDGSTITPFVRTGIGLGAAPGTPKPDISTREALTRALLDARSVAYSRKGQSGIYFLTLLDQLGIADEVLAKATELEKGFTANALFDGSADLAVQQISELLYVPGTELVGPLPEEVQRYTEFSVAIGAEAQQRAAAEAFVSFVSGPGAAEAYLRTRLEPVSH